MTIFQVLSQQQRDVAALFRRIYVCLENGHVPLARAAFQTLSTKLIAGMRAEHAVVYPRLAFAGLSLEVEEAMREHTEIEATINHLRLAPLPVEDWQRVLELLERQLSHHVETEEDQLFPFANLTLTPDELAEMAADYEAFELLAAPVASASITYELISA